MATHPDFTLEDDEQAIQIRQLKRDSEKLEAEARKLMAEANKLSAEELKFSAEQLNLTRDRLLSPWLLLAQGALAAAALMGAGAAFARLFLAR